MTTMMQGGFGGSVRQTGPTRLEANYPHWFVSVLLCFPIAIFGLATIVGILGVAGTGELGMLFVPVASAAFGGFLATRLWHRLRSMGSFVLDLERGELVRSLGQREVDHHRVEEIVSVDKRWDPFHRQFGRHFWLVVETRDGRRYRLGKAQQKEVDDALERLRSWGLPVRSRGTGR